MPNFLLRNKRGRVRVGVFREPVVVAWQSTNARSASVSATGSDIRGNQTSTRTSGQFTLDIPGTYSIAYRFNFSARGTVRISVGGTTEVNRNNHTSATTLVDTGPCAPYDIPNARSTCRPGYTKMSKTQTRWWGRYTRTDQRSGYRSSASYSLWVDGTEAPTRSNVLSRISGYLYTISGLQYPPTRRETRTVYYCQPTSGCREQERRETGFTPLLHGTLSTTVSAPRPVPSQPAPQPSQPAPQPTVQVPAPDIPPPPQVAQTSIYTQAKYEVITPARYVESGGVIRPELRYRSVRVLTAPQVSNLIALGYSVQSVPPDTPTVESTAYGPSVVAAAQADAPNTVPVITRREPRRRVGIASVDRAASAGAPQSANWRDRGRRVVR